MTNESAKLTDQEELVARVLTGLRDVEATPGLERRILEAAKQRAALHPSPRRWQRLTWGLAAAGLATIFLLAAAVHQGRQQSTPMPAPSPTQQAITGEPAPPISPAQPPPPLRRVRQASSQTPSAKRVGVALTPQSEPVDATRAASFPAPPLPLTDQEKLLLRLVHKGDPVEMAMLTPETRARQQAEGKAEFQRFFDLHTPGEDQ